jgi:CSLREA domain-containing protein
LEDCISQKPPRVAGLLIESVAILFTAERRECMLRQMLTSARRLIGVLLAAALLVLLAAMPGVAHGGGLIVVTKTADTEDGTCDDDCSLREAVLFANEQPEPDTILLGINTYNLSRAYQDDGTGGPLLVTSEMTILGAAAQSTATGAGPEQTVIDAGRKYWIFEIAVGGSMTIEGLTVQHAEGGFDVGAFNVKGELFIDNLHMLENFGGGAIRAGFTSTVEVRNSLIDGNSGDYAGGIENSGDLLVENTIISNNKAEEAGGVFSEGNSAIFRNVEVRDNEAREGSFATGGMYLDDESVELTNVTVANNSAKNDEFPAGGIFAEGLLVATNLTVTGNSAQGPRGTGGVFARSGSMLINATITGNTTSSSGVGGVEGSPTIKNSIIANNTPDNCALSVVHAEGKNIDSGDTCDFPPATNLNDTDPMLDVLADNGGSVRTMALLGGSPALDAAVDCPPPATDARGTPRPRGTACDIGAFEAGTVETTGREWADLYCDGDATELDIIVVLAYVADVSSVQPAGGDCPEADQSVFVGDWFFSHLWADVNCDDVADPEDALHILLADAGIPKTPPVACPAVGQTVEIG